jgi:hypothetical protein
VDEAARIIGSQRRSVYYWAHRYLDHHIVFVWLPKQCSEFKAMDQLWKELKDDLASNRQFKNID